MRVANKETKVTHESGIALFFALFALLLLSAIAASLVLMTNTETAVNSNYRRERVADFGAKAGYEEVRDRMVAANPTTIAANLPVTPPPGNGTVLYILNEGNQPGTVQPWNAGNAYMDDELCHDGYPFNGGMQQQSNLGADVRCTQLPPGPNWYTTVASTAPWSGTSAALPYKWVRVAMKVNGTVQGPAGNVTSYYVNVTPPINPTAQVCWNGKQEVLLSGPDRNGNPATKCQDMTVPQSNSPVYVITSFGATASGTRKIVQAEVAQDPLQPLDKGLYALGTTCPSLTLHGGGNSNPFTDSFSSTAGNYGGANATPTGGDVGANGGVSLSGHSQVGGKIAVLSQAPSPPGPPSPCAGPNGDYSTSGANAGPYNPGGLYPQNQVTTIVQPYTFPTPPDPIPAPLPTSPIPSTPCQPPASGICAVPGTYGAISLSGGTLTLAPGTYNIYSLNITGGSTSVTVNPPGAVILNFPSASTTPISIAGQGIVNPTNIPNNFQINYGGTGTVSLAGKGSMYAVVDAPNAAVAVSGNGDTFGRIIGRTLDYGGNGKFHFDKALIQAPPNYGIYRVLSFRDVAY
jgi:hypothetical protein